jgi:TolB-like protein/DNA-binding winged helix-turn-helix (wHTH) protein
MGAQEQVKLRIGDWTVDRMTGEIARGSESSRLEIRSLRLLLTLADHAPRVVSVNELLDQVWPEVTVTPDSVYQAVTALRRQLGDDSKRPSYIASIPRLGYRMIASVSSVDESNTNFQANEPAPATPARSLRSRSSFLWIGLATFCLLIVLYPLISKRSGMMAPATAMPSVSQKSIAVLPLLDLTDEMDEEPFADGMTEELIDRLSKIPGLRVASPTSSFFYKGKQLPVAETAHALGVAYILDGSVRKSGQRLRVSARLVRGDNGYVVWTESYDRSFQDRLSLQDDIAGEVAKALSASSILTH